MAGHHEGPGRAATTSARVEQLDLTAVVEIAQAISVEIVLDRLIHRLMTLAVEHAGAARGLLILPGADGHRVEAEATTDCGRVEVRLGRALPTSDELPESVLRFVLRTQGSVILDDASADDLFSSDEYIRRNASRSILCLPLLKQMQLNGVLYLENGLTSHAFTPARIAVLKLLASQAAISLENARLYSRLREENSERARAEEELRKSEARWRAIFESSALGIALTDLSGQFVAVNPAYRSMLGYSEAELRNLSIRMITHEDDREHNVDLVTELIEGSRASFDLVKRIRRKDGELIWVNVSASLVPGTEGVPQFILGIVENITERKNAEEALSLTQAELAHVSRVMTMGELTASIAHEVNQPCAAVMTNGQACLNWLKRTPPDLEKVRAAVEEIILNAQRGSEVIGRIRALVKKANPQKTSLRINDVAEEVVALVQGEARKRDVSLRTELDAGLPAIEGDRVQLQQVILNLLMNGIEASEAVRDRPRELVIRSQPYAADSVLVAVQDAGVGFDPNHSSRLFEAFFTTKAGGMGLGLSISRSIIDAHRGRLWASRNDGPGATFQFVLPARIG